MEKLITIIATIVISIAGILFLSFLLSWPIYMLWNGCLVDAVSTLKEVTWLQAWGISVLFGLLFKSSNSSK
jgi:hypothetical protein